MEAVRLQKYISECGVMSRRAAEKAIENNEIKVNGKPAVIGQKINPMKDTVLYNGKTISKKRNSHCCYIMLYKPEGYLTTLSDDKGRKTIVDLISSVKERVYPIGRLDMDSEGMLLLTNDGELTNALSHPRHMIPKIYHVRIEGHLNAQDLEKLSSALVIDGYRIKPVECKVISQNDKCSTVEMILYEGRNRQIRKMFEIVGYRIRRLRRIAIGDLELDVSRGKWRYLTKAEVDYLKQAAKISEDPTEIV